MCRNNSPMEKKTKLKVVLFEQGIKQSWLAKQAGIKEQTISDIVNRRRRPSLQTAIRIAKALNMHVEDLFDEEEKD